MTLTTCPLHNYNLIPFATLSTIMGSMINLLQLRAVIFKEGDWWVAQCLEYDIAAQAKTTKDLTYELQRVVIGHIVACRQEGITPFEHLPKPPEKYERMFNEGLEVCPPKNMQFTYSSSGEAIPAPELRLAA